MPRQLARDLWCIDHDFRIAFANVGTRTTLVRMPDGSLLVHSPGPATAAELEAVRALGTVTSLVAPNLMHHLFVPRWAKAFPEALIYAAPGLRERVAALRVDEVLGDEPPRAWNSAVRTHVVRGAPSVNEV